MKWKLRIAVLGGLIAAMLGLSALPALADPQTPLTTDHFLGYFAGSARGTTFQTKWVRLIDQFNLDGGRFTVKKPVKLYNPAAKTVDGDTTPIGNPAKHLVGYKVSRQTGTPFFPPFQVTNQFHPQGIRFNLLDANMLLVPSTKALEGEELIPNRAIDHFLCYPVESSGPLNIPVSLQDQFRNVAGDSKVLKPTRLCTPVQKTVVTTNGDPLGEPVGDPNAHDHLMCYAIERIDAVRRQVQVNNQFGDQRLVVKRNHELCVPSHKLVDTTTTITSDLPDPSVVGQPYLVFWTVTASAGNPMAGSGTVTVTGGSGCGPVPVGVGGCFVTSTTAGPKTLMATYSGDSHFSGSSDTEPHQVNRANTTTTITSDLPDPSVVGQTYLVLWTVTVNAPGAGMPTGTVTVTGGSGCGPGPVGAAGCFVTSTIAGAKTLMATYSGDPNFNGSSDTEPHQVNPSF